MSAAKKKSEPQVPPASQERNASALPQTSPLVFISHDTRDADLAEAFGNLLTDASGGVLQSFRSSDRKGTAGIEFGAEWYTSIMGKLSCATDVVALLTNHSLDRPWILYEAGVAKGKLDSTVLGLALNIPLEKTNSGPFAQFQNCADDEDSLTKLVLQLIKRNPQAAPREEAVRRQVQAFQTSVKAMADKRTKPSEPQKLDENAVARMFEEVKVLFRDLPERVTLISRESNSEKRRRQKFHPAMFLDTIHMSKRRDGTKGAAVAILVLFSRFKDNQPWLFELGMQLYAALNTGDMKQIDATRRGIYETLEIIRSSPLEMELFQSGEDHDAFFFLRHVLDSLDDFLPRRVKKSDMTAPVENS